jgi:nicotinamide mononucleotide (NMN) deamidase PncC
MLPAISTAAKGLAVQSRRIEEVAQAVASSGAAAPAGGSQGNPETQVSIGALPVGVSVQSVATLVDAQHAYRANAAVIETTADMFADLLDILDTE